MILFCHVIFQDHVIIVSFDLIGRELQSCQVWWPQALRLQSIFLVCHLISRDHVIKVSCDFTGRGIFGCHRHCVSEVVFSVVEEEDSTCSSIHNYCLSLKDMA